MNIEFNTPAEAAEYFTALECKKLPVMPETWAGKGFTDDGRETVVLYRKSGKNAFWRGGEMKWSRFVGQTGISYYSGKIGDKDCRWIHEHEGKFLVDKGPVFVDTLEKAKEYHHANQQRHRTRHGTSGT